MEIIKQIRTGIELIGIAQKQLKELHDIALKEQHEKGFVLKKINELILNIGSLNSIPKQYIDKYHSELENFVKELQEKQKPLHEMLSDLDHVLEDIRSFDFKALDEFTDKYIDDPNKQLELSNVFNIDKLKLDELLSTYTDIRLKRKRKRWLWVSKYIFGSLRWLARTCTITLLFIIGYCAEFIAKIIFPTSPDFVAGIVIVLIFAYSIDKFIDKKADIFFWSTIRKQILSLGQQVATYTQQIQMISEFMSERHP